MRTIYVCTLMAATAILSAAPAWTQSSGGIPGFGGSSRGNPIQNLIPPKGSNFNFYLDSQRNPHYTYEGPENFKDPIRIWFKEEDKYTPNRKPDLYVWADEIHWHAGIQSGTAAGRIIVDNSTEYRIETTYVEYDHKTRQIYCPRQVKIIQRLPQGPDNVIVAESALVTLDEKGIKSARFDGFLETDIRPTDQAPNPFKREERPKPAAPPPPKKELIPSLPGTGGRKQIAPPVSYGPSPGADRAAQARVGP